MTDGGQLGFVARWWTARTHFRQMPFEFAVTRSILHLPSDKTFLAGCADRPFSPENFIVRFKRAARLKLFRRRLFSLAEALLRKEQEYVGRLS